MIPDQTRAVRMEELLHSEPCRDVSVTLSLIGNKWSVFAIMLLSEKPRRFNELRRAIGGVSQRMLTLTLRQLEREGLVSRTVFPTIPVRVDYELTGLGHSLKEPVLALGRWAIHNQPALKAARQRFDENGPAE